MLARDRRAPAPLQCVLALLALASVETQAQETRFYAVAPCRFVDTRTTANAPALAGGSTRSFVVAGRCGTPPTAKAVAVNLTVTGPTGAGHIRLFPTGQALPSSSALNYSAAQSRANNALVAVGADGSLSLYCAQSVGSVHAILDVSGYTDDPANNQPPSVTAGPSQSITLPATANLTATAKDDGKPSGALTYAWSLASGPAAVAFSAPNALATTAAFSSSGAYTLRFTASDSALSTSTDVTVVVRTSLGPPKTGGMYHLGPVDFAETEWTNACSPYPASLQSVTGLGAEWLAGVSNTYAGGGSVCDCCVKITTAVGRTRVARIVTYGETSHASNLDVSPSVYQSLNPSGDEWPRIMSWELTPCPTTAALSYQFKTGSNIWWTALWIRNAKLPVTKVEVKSANNPSFEELLRETDGSVYDRNGFGSGAFTLRITGMDGQVLTETLPGFSAGQIITSTMQFQ